MSGVLLKKSGARVSQHRACLCLSSLICMNFFIAYNRLYPPVRTVTLISILIYLLTAIGLTPGGSSTVQYSTVQYSIAQYSTVQHSTVQHSTVEYSTVQYSIAQHSTVQYSTVQYSIVQYSTVQYSTVHIYTQTIHRTTHLTNWEECGLCPIFASYTLAFALQLGKRHRKTLIQGS